MRREAIVESIELTPLGEIRMGCDAYGLIINTNFGRFDVFSDIPVIVGYTDHTKCVIQSSCKRYILVQGESDTYILDIKDQTVSLYKTTIRGDGNTWSEEQAIYGSERAHIKGFPKTYYLQFPFVKQSQFSQFKTKFDNLRKQQIKDAVNAI